MLLSRFCRDRAGNVAILFSVLVVPIVAMVGAAVDYSRAASVRAELQAGLDATALMLAKEARSLSATQLKSKANAYFKAMFNRPEAKGITLDPSFVTSGSSFTVKVGGKGSVDTTFTRLIGHKTMDIASTAEVTWSVRRLELALALDNTGSMQSSNKMTELKKAVHALLDTLQKTAQAADDVKVAIIPFDTTVNVGTGYKDEPWFDWKTNKIAKDSWKGCVADRTQPNDTRDTAPTGAATYFPATDCGDLVGIQPLTNDWAALHAKVDSMQPNGTTNVTIGLVWGWHALTPGAPLSEGSAPRHDLDKVIVLLTDGDNTKNRWSDNPKDIDPRTKLACDNVKAAKIALYVVRVINGNAQLLKDCATNSTMYYDVQNASSLNAVFTNIAQAITSLRIAK